MNKQALRAVMARNGETAGKLCKVLKMTESTFSEKINEKVKIGFTQAEIQTIKDHYHLSSEEIDLIFFDKAVS